ERPRHRRGPAAPMRCARIAESSAAGAAAPAGSAGLLPLTAGARPGLIAIKPRRAALADSATPGRGMALAMNESSAAAVIDAAHAHTAADVVAALHSSRDLGLDAAAAAERLGRFGPNQLPAAKPVHPLWRFAAQFRNALIAFLVAAVAACALGHYVDA